MRTPVLTSALCGLMVALTPGPALGATHLGDRGLRPGARGHDVRVLQGMLTRAGFRTHVDGDFGPGTTSHVKKFQAAAQLTVSGVVGKITVQALRTAVASVSAPTVGGFSADTPPPATTTAVAATPPPAPAGKPGTINPDGTANPPAGAPPQIVALFAAANKIATTPYRYGGGHASFEDDAYDCSGSVSYALHAAGLLDRTMTSGELASDWGQDGPGSWITVYANDEHVYMYVAGLRFDTSGQRQAGTRWQADVRSNDGFVVRHFPGL